MEAGGGPRSLGHLRPRGEIALDVSYGKAKLHLSDVDLGALRLPITDLRLFNPETGDLHEDLPVSSRTALSIPRPLSQLACLGPGPEITMSFLVIGFRSTTFIWKTARSGVSEPPDLALRMPLRPDVEPRAG